MDLEKELEQIAKQYRDEGYVVITHPDADHLPAFAAEFGVDLLATRGEQGILVQVKKDRSALEIDSKIPMRAGITNVQPGWRYDLVVLNEDDPFRRMTRDAREPSNEEIDQSLQHVETLIQAGDLRAALVFAWAAIEAAMRRAAVALELYLPRTTATELLRTLYGNGVLTRNEFDLLRDSYRLRTEIVHGLIASAIDPGLVREIVGVVRGLLSRKPDAQSVAG